MLKEVKENMIIMCNQIGNINKETQIVLKRQMEILELKSIITQMKNSLEDTTVDLRWWNLKIIQPKNKIKIYVYTYKKEQSLIELWDTVKSMNITEMEKIKERKKIFEEIMAETSKYDEKH